MLRFGKFVIPILTVFLFLALDGFIVARINKPYIYQNDNEFHIPVFCAKDLNGNSVTQDIFAGHFTVVCLWVTKDAKNTRKLMSDMKKLKNSAPNNFRLVGIVGDIREDSDKMLIERARSCSQTFSDIPQIIPNDELAAILSRIRNAPTVFFVDDEGKITGQPVVGYEPVLIEKELLRLIEKDSAYNKINNRVQKNIFYTF